MAGWLARFRPVERIQAFPTDPVVILDAVVGHPESASRQQGLVDRAAHMANTIDDRPGEGVRTLLAQIVARVQVYDDRIEIAVDATRLLTTLEGRDGGSEPSDAVPDTPILLRVKAQLKRTGIGYRMVLANGFETAPPDPSL